MVKDRIEEKRLVYKVQMAQDADAFGALYRRYIEKIYRFVFFKTGDRATSEDIVSEVFLRTWNYLTDGERQPVESFSGFVYQVARHAVVDWYRSRASAEINEYPLDEAESRRATISGEAAGRMDAAVDAAIHLERTYGAIRKMKQEYQEVIVLRYVDELPIRDIALIMGKGQTAVRVTLHRAMKKLREMLNEGN